jgi:hypothetical protein
MESHHRSDQNILQSGNGIVYGTIFSGGEYPKVLEKAKKVIGKY